VPGRQVLRKPRLIRFGTGKGKGFPACQLRLRELRQSADGHVFFIPGDHFGGVDHPDVPADGHLLPDHPDYFLLFDRAVGRLLPAQLDSGCNHAGIRQSGQTN